MSGSPYFLGIDGGGTRTRATLGELTGRVLGQGEAAGSNYHNVGATTAADRIVQATRNACRQAGLPLQPPAAAFIGAAGIKTPHDTRALAAAIAASPLGPTPQIQIVNDSENAHAGALAGRSGVVTIAGTGSVALGRNAAGKSFLCGGWGWLLDDIGSGAWIGLEGLRRVALAVDDRASPTQLTAALLAQLGLEDPHTLLERIYVQSFGAAEAAQLAPTVQACAARGDEAASEILGRGAAGLARLTLATARGAHLPEDPPLAFVGGGVRPGTPYRLLVEARAREALPRARLSEPVFSPAIGALIRAYQLAGVALSPALLDRLKTSASLSSS